MKALPKEIMDSYRPVFLRGETVQSLNSLTWNCHDKAAGVPGNHATRGNATRGEGFPPLSEEIAWTSLRPN